MKIYFDTINEFKNNLFSYINFDNILIEEDSKDVLKFKLYSSEFIYSFIINKDKITGYIISRKLKPLKKEFDGALIFKDMILSDDVVKLIIKNIIKFEFLKINGDVNERNFKNDDTESSGVNLYSM